MSNGSKFQRRQWVWIMLMADLVFFMLLMTLGIIALQVGNTLPDTDKQIEVSVNDEHGKEWRNATSVEIFSSSYVNGKGETTIASSDGSPVVAPGFESSYSFTLYNTNTVAVSCETNVSFEFRVNKAVDDSFTELPLLVRLYTVDDNGIVRYLAGGETESGHRQGEKLSQELNGTYQISVLGANSYQKFILETWWEFDVSIANDVIDTYLGNIAAESGSATVTMNIGTWAAAHLDPDATGGTKVGETMTYSETMHWLWLVFLMINAAILIFYIAWLLNKRSMEMNQADLDRELDSPDQTDTNG